MEIHPFLEGFCGHLGVNFYKHDPLLGHSGNTKTRWALGKLLLQVTRVENFDNFSRAKPSAKKINLTFLTVFRYRYRERELYAINVMLLLALFYPRRSNQTTKSTPPVLPHYRGDF